MVGAVAISKGVGVPSRYISLLCFSRARIYVRVESARHDRGFQEEASARAVCTRRGRVCMLGVAANLYFLV